MTSLEEARLRGLLRQTQRELQLVELELATRMAEIREFDAKIEARLGGLETELEVLETQIRIYQKQLYEIQKEDMFPNWVDYSKRASTNPTHADPDFIKRTPSSPEAELRQLYRDLARKYHPDTAFDDLDRQYRNEMMIRINEDYAQGNLEELRKHARGMVHIPIDSEQPPPTKFRSAREKIEAELVVCQTKLRETQNNIEQLRFHPSVQLSLNVKLSWNRGKDLIGEMAKELQAKIAQKTIKRDALFAELKSLQQ